TARCTLSLHDALPILTLAMGEKEPGYVDAYYGPETWVKLAKAQERSLTQLDEEVVRLKDRIHALPKDAEPACQRFLQAQLEAARSEEHTSELQSRENL